MRYVSGRTLASDLKSDQALRRIRGWLKHCTGSHSHDDSPTDVSMERPTLLLDVGFIESANLRLVENDEAATAPYIALSYVWGRVPERLKRLYLNTGTKTGYLEKIPESELPDTIRDAIFVTRGLGIRYLWVDALCIVQDDKNLKDKEIMKMHDIYAGSYLTVQAASTSAVMDSFLVKRSGHALPDQRLRYSQKGSTKKPQYIYMRPAELSTKQGGLVETRAWCYEEFFLPKRLLVMAKGQMYYCCGASTEWEGNKPSSITVADSRSLRRLALTPWHQHLRPDQVPLSSRPPDPRLDHLRLWYEILVTDYTPRIVTNDVDRLRAIAGIAKVIQKRNREIGAYQVGLWMEDLPWGLLWSTRRLQQSPFHKREMGKAWRDHYKRDLMFRPSGAAARCRAPSWSWGSVIGPVYCNFTARFVHKLLAKVLRFPPGEDFLGKKEDWKIILDAPTKRVHVGSILRTRQELNAKGKPHNHLGPPPVSGAVHTVLLSVPELEELPEHFALAKFDVAEDEAVNRGHSVLCLFISEELGLIVEPASTKEAVEVIYRRLGTFISWCNFYEGEPSATVALI